MPTELETYAVVIRNLPKEHFKDLSIYVRNTLARARLADAAEDDSQTNGTERPRDAKVDALRPEKSTGSGAQARERSHSLDPQASLPSPDVLGFYNVPRGLIQPTNTPPPWRHGYDLDRGHQVEEVTTLMRSMSLGGHRDSHCDAVVDFIHKKDARDFGDYCENSDHKQKLQVDALYPDIFTTVSAEVLLDSDLGQTLTSSTKGKGICDDIATRSGVEVKLTKSSIKFIGKDWQVAVAKYHIESYVVNFAQHLMRPDESRLRSAASSERTHQETEAKENRPLRDAASNEETDQIQNGRFVKVVTLNEKDESVNGEVRRRNRVIKAGPGVAVSDDKDDQSESTKPPRAKPTPAKRNSLEIEGKEPDTIKKAKLDKEENAEEGEYTEEEQDEPSGRSQGRSSDTPQDEHHTGEGLEDSSTKVTTTQKMPFKCNFYIKSSYWSYLEREANFMKQLDRTLNDTKTMKEIDIDGDKCILTISGPSERAVGAVEAHFTKAYAGFEFNLEDKDISKYVWEKTFKIRHLENIFPQLVFYKEEDKDMVVGFSSDITSLMDHMTEQNSSKDTDVESSAIRGSYKNSGASNPGAPQEAPPRPKKSGDKQTIVTKETLTIATPIYKFIEMHLKDELQQLRELCAVEVRRRTEQTEVILMSTDEEIHTQVKNKFSAFLDNIRTETFTFQNAKEAQMAVEAYCTVIQYVIAELDGKHVQVTFQKSEMNKVADIFANIKNQVIPTSDPGTSQSQKNPSTPKPRERHLKPTGGEKSSLMASSTSGKPALFSPIGFNLFGLTDVLIHKSDLTRLSVDAIVNAANDTLQHGGGVAKVIADKAGPALDREGEAILKQMQRNLRDSEVVVTTGGNLPCRKVLHAVGPQWYRYPDKRKCANILEDTFRNILDKADKERFRSIALPPISSGIYRVPHDVVAETMVRSIINTLNINRTHSLRSLHLVDITDSLLSMISEELYSYQRRQTSVSDIVQIDSQRVDEEISRVSVTLPRGFLIGHLQVFLHQSDITRLHVGIITSVTNTNFDQHSGLARVIGEAAGADYRNDCKKMFEIIRRNKQGDLIVTTLSGYLPCDAVYHAVIPRYPTKETRSQRSYAETLSKVLVDIFKKANQSGHGTIALPPFGSGQFQYPSEVVAETTREVLLNTAVTSALTEIHIVDVKCDTLLLIAKKLAEHKRVKAIDKEFVEPRIQDMLFNEGYVMVPDSRRVEPMDTLDGPRKQRSNSSGGAIPKSYASATASNLPKGETASPTSDTKRPLVFSSAYRQENKESVSRAETMKNTPKPADKPGKKSEEDNCVICMGQINGRKVLDCKHAFCTDCIDECFKRNGPKCPSCGEIFGKVKGTQPKGGRMDVTRESWTHLPGYHSCGTIKIHYYIPGGTQGPEHPNPGKYFTGVSRDAYLPDNKEGNEIVNLLKRAFDARLIFTVGRSTSSGLEDQTTWNDIHHKTRTHGGSQSFGYPDPTYLSRVRDELAAKGIK